MDKINYNQHDWSKGEVIKEENLDNMENGIKQATDKINEIIDTEQDFRDRMTDIDGRIDINNEELVIARDGCDNLGQRIERDQQYIYNILNDGSYLEFNGTDIDIANAKDGYTKDTILKGQTYHNLITGGTYQNIKFVSNGKGQFSTFEANVVKDEQYTIVLNITENTVNSNLAPVQWHDTTTGNVIINPKQKGIIKNTFTPNKSGTNASFTMNFFDLNTEGQLTIDYILILEGDWTNKEVPNTYINGIESVGDKEDNKISILSQNKNLFDSTFEIGTISADNGNNLEFTSRGRSGFVKLKENCLNLNVFNNFMINRIFYYDINKNYLNNALVNSSNITIYNSNAKYFRIAIMDATDNNRNLTQSDVILANNSVVYSSSNVENYIEPKEDKKEILLPIEGGLKSLPDGTCDTIEQREDGVYLVQKVGKIVLNGSENWTEFRIEPSGLGCASLHINNVAVLKPMITSRLKRIYWNNSPWNSEEECISIGAEDNKDLTNYSFVVYLNANTLDNFKANLQANPTTIYYELATAIETKLDIDTINLQVFKYKTYILSENSIKPEIVCKAPVDVNQTIADLQEEQKRLMETYNTLKAQNEEVEMAISELNGQDDVQTADMLDLDMRVLALEEGL